MQVKLYGEDKKKIMRLLQKVISKAILKRRNKDNGLGCQDWQKGYLGPKRLYDRVFQKYEAVNLLYFYYLKILFFGA